MRRFFRRAAVATNGRDSASKKNDEPHRSGLRHLGIVDDNQRLDRVRDPLVNIAGLS